MRDSPMRRGNVTVSVPFLRVVARFRTASRPHKQATPLRVYLKPDVGQPLPMLYREVTQAPALDREVVGTQHGQRITPASGQLQVYTDMFLLYLHPFHLPPGQGDIFVQEAQQVQSAHPGWEHEVADLPGPGRPHQLW